MGRIGPNRQNAASREQPLLIEIVRLLARQAVREWVQAAQSADLLQTTSTDQQE